MIVSLAFSVSVKYVLLLLLFIHTTVFEVTSTDVHPHYHEHILNHTVLHDQINITEATSIDTLKLALKESVGVYKQYNESNPYHPLVRNTVIVTGCNYGFLNHLLNFKCFMDRLQMKFLVIAMDKKAYHYLMHNTTMTAYLLDGGAVGEVTEDSTTFRSKQFNMITTKKKEAVHDILVLGYDVIFTDTDVAIVRDPIPYLIWNNVDYVHSLNLWCSKDDVYNFFYTSRIEGNTGFYYVKSNHKTIKLWQAAYEASNVQSALDDQAIFWSVIRRTTDPPIKPIGKCQHYYSNAMKVKDENSTTLVTCVLDNCVFSSGMLSRQWVPEFTYEMLQEMVVLRNDTICAVHANYITGNGGKMEKMKQYGFWLSHSDLKGLSNVCNSYVEVPVSTSVL